MFLVKPELVAAIIRDAGGEIVGRTRLQKVAYLLDVAGYGDGFYFTYKNFGPFSEGVADSARFGALLGHISEVEQQAAWGGIYSIYSVETQPDESVPLGRRELARRAANSDTIVLELTATAVYLSLDDYADPWAETERRKPVKIGNGRLKKAKDLLVELRKIEVPNPLPDIV